MVTRHYMQKQIKTCVTVVIVAAMLQVFIDLELLTLTC